ncbi:MAG TPA: AAA family ATPase [Gemmatales bacterium]|nr:AAA family ATPase [Gemmatales bacterium]
MKLPLLVEKTAGSAFSKPLRRKDTFKISPHALWQAFCRKWWQAILLGLIVAGLIGPAIWFLVPLANPTVYTRVQFLERSPGNWQGHPDPPIHRQTQIALIKDPITLASVIRRPEVAQLSIIKEQEEPEEWLMKELRVDFPSGPELMQFTMSGDRPQELKVLVNAVKEVYLQNFGGTTLKDRQDRLKRLTDYDAQVKREIKALYEKMKASAEQGREVHQETIIAKHKVNAEFLEQTRRELIKTKADLRQYHTDLKLAEQSTAAALPLSSKLVEDRISKHPSLQPLLEEFAMTDDLLKRTKEVAPTNPKVAQYQKELAEIQKKIDARKAELMEAMVAEHKNLEQGNREQTIEVLRLKIKQLEETEKVLQESYDQLARTSEQLNTATVAVEEEKQTIAVLENIRSRLAVAIEQLKAEKDAPDRIRSFNDVVITSSEKYLNKIRFTIIGTLGAFLGMLLLVAFLESRARRITSSEEVLDHFGMNVVGSVPAPPKRLGISFSRADEDAWQNVLTESVDAFRTQLVFKARHHKQQVIMVSSADSGEGKTSLACHLALSLARSGQKTLLIDADLRNPTINHLFDVPLEPGLSEVLLGIKTAAEVIQRSSSPGLWLMPAGHCNRRVVELLAQDSLKTIFADLRQESARGGSAADRPAYRWGGLLHHAPGQPVQRHTRSGR